MSDTIIIVPNPDNAGDSIQIAEGGGGMVNTVNGRVGDVVLTNNDVGLSAVSNDSFNSILNNLTNVESNSGNWNNAYSFVNIYGNSILENDAIVANKYEGWDYAFYFTTTNGNDIITVDNIVKNDYQNWNTAYSYVISNSSIEANQQLTTGFVLANSANILAVDTIVNNTSGNWNIAYSYVINNSSIEANQQLATAFILANSANIVSVNTIVNNTSANWNSVYSYVNYISTNNASVNSLVNNTSANWNSVYSYVNNISTGNASVNSIVNNTSGNWNSVYSYVNNISTGNASVNSIVNNTSGNWNSVYSYVNGVSTIQASTNTFILNNKDNIVAVDTLVNKTSGNWNAVYTYVNGTSALGNTFVNTYSGNILAVDTLVNNTSANWNSVYTDVNSNSASWIGGNTAYTNLVANSSTYLQARISGTDNQITVSNNPDGSAVISLPNTLRTPGDLSVGGSLYVAGTSVALNTSTLTVSSPIIYLNESLHGQGNVYDIGLVGHFNNGLYQHTGLVRSALSGVWSLFSGLTTEPLDGPTLHYSDPTFKIDTLRANILGSLSGTVIGDITGSAQTIDGISRNSLESLFTYVSQNSAYALIGNNIVPTQGTNNTIEGNYSVIVGGNTNSLSGNNSFVLGSNINAIGNNSTFVNSLCSQGLITATGLALYNSRVQFLERPTTANGNYLILSINGEVQAIRLFTPIIVGVNFINSTGDGDWANVHNWTDINGYPVTYLPDNQSDISLYNSVNQVSEGVAAANTINFYDNISWGAGATLVVSNSAYFHQNSTFAGVLSGDANFLDSSTNTGTIDGNASFTGTAINSGTVYNNATFSQGAINQNSTGHVAGNVIVYYPSPYPIGGRVDGSISYRGYFATKFVGTANDGNWNNLANWTDDFGLPVVYLPDANSNIGIYSNVTSVSGNVVTVNNVTFYDNAAWGSGLTLNATNVTLTQESSNHGTITGRASNLFRLYDYSTNTGTINSDIEVHHPSPNPIGGTVNGNITYIGYVTPIVSSHLINIEGPSNITSITVSCNGNTIFPTFNPDTTDYAVVTNSGSGSGISYSVTINGNTTSGTATVDQALQIYNTTNIYYIRFINNNVPLGNVTTSPQAGYVPGFYAIGYNDYYPVIYDHNGVPIWYCGYNTISVHKGKDRNRIFLHQNGGPQKVLQLSANAIQAFTYDLLNNDGSWVEGWDVHEGQELTGPSNRTGNIMGHVYTNNGFYLQEQDTTHTVQWDWHSHDCFNNTWYDYYHNNSIDVHPTTGQILISMRHVGAVAAIDHDSKNVLWVISGRYYLNGAGTLQSVAYGSRVASTKWMNATYSNINNEPTYNGFQYSGTVGNHDARWHPEIAPIHNPNNVVISIYDDESQPGDGFPGNNAPACRGVIYEIDPINGVAYHRSSVFSPNGTSSYRGSYTVVQEDNGTWSHVLDTVTQYPKILEFNSSSIDSPSKPLVFAMDFGGIPYRIVKFKQSFFDLDVLRSTVGISF